MVSYVMELFVQLLWSVYTITIHQADNITKTDGAATLSKLYKHSKREGFTSPKHQTILEKVAREFFYSARLPPDP